MGCFCVSSLPGLPCRLRTRFFSNVFGPSIHTFPQPAPPFNGGDSGPRGTVYSPFMCMWVMLSVPLSSGHGLQVEVIADIFASEGSSDRLLLASTRVIHHFSIHLKWVR